MADDEEEQEPAVELGEGEPVEGAPLARVSSRLTWPIQKSRLDALEGESVIRTPEGPKTISEVLEAIDITYFEKRQEFEAAVRDVVGRGAIPTADE
jgi:hypothetical protein